MEKFIVVLTKVLEEASDGQPKELRAKPKKKTPLYLMPTTDMKVFPDPERVLDFVAHLGVGNKTDQRRVKSIFSVSDKGNISHYEILFNGRLILVPTLSTIGPMDLEEEDEE